MIRIWLTKSDFKGDINNTKDCPLARAIKRQMGVVDTHIADNDMILDGKLYVIINGFDIEKRVRMSKMIRFLPCCVCIRKFNYDKDWL